MFGPVIVVEAGLLNCINCIQFRVELGTILTRRFEQRPHFG